MKNNLNLEHWSGPNGCHEDCPACDFKINIKNYKKDSSKQFLTSVALTEDHKKFLKKEKLNLSEIVRDVLDNLIKQAKDV